MASLRSYKISICIDFRIESTGHQKTIKSLNIIILNCIRDVLFFKTGFLCVALEPVLELAL